MRRQRGFHMLQDIVGAVQDLTLTPLPPFHAVSVQHQAAPDTPEGAQRKGLSLLVREKQFIVLAPNLLKHLSQLIGHRHKAVCRLGLQAIHMSASSKINIALDVYLLHAFIEVCP